MDEAGDVKVSYLDYWKDLTGASQGNLVEEDNARTAVVMYEELLSQIITKTTEFKEAGVEKEEMQRQIEAMEHHLEEDFLCITENMRLSVAEELSNLRGNIEKAKKMVTSVYDSSQ